MSCTIKILAYSNSISPDNESVKCECISSYIPLDNQDVSKECHPPTTIIYCVEKNFKLEVFEDTDFQFDTNCVRVTSVDL